jgi:BMFP domain-containing protein YqiC
MFFMVDPWKWEKAEAGQFKAHCVPSYFFLLIRGIDSSARSPAKNAALRLRSRGDKRTTLVHLAVSPACAKLDSPETTAASLTTMLDPKILEELGARLSALIAASPAADIEKNARALLASGLAKLDLVSREEFDIQTRVLQRTREKLTALEARLDRLENPPDPPDQAV